MRKLIVPLVVAVLAGTACWPFSGEKELSPMTLKAIEGTVELLRNGESIDVGGGETSIQALDVIVTDSDSAAELRLDCDCRVELASVSRAIIVDNSSIEGQRGSLLAFAKDPMAVRFGEVTAAGHDAIFRVDRNLASARTAAYTGKVEVGVPGQPRLQVPPLFEADVPGAAELPTGATPYRLQASDPWDQRHFQKVVRLQRELTRLGDRLTKFVDKAVPSIEFFAELAGQPVGFMGSELTRRRADDLLTGFFIAQNAPKGDLASNFKRAFDLFDRGALWAVVAAIMDVQTKTLVSDLTDVVTATSKQVAENPGGAVFDAPGIPPSDPQPTAPTQPSPGPTKSKPSPSPSPTKSPDRCDGTIDCSVQDLFPEDEPSPTPSEAPQGVSSGVVTIP